MAPTLIIPCHGPHLNNSLSCSELMHYCPAHTTHSTAEHTLSDGKATAFLKKFRPNFDRTDLNLSTSKFFKKKT